MSNMTICVGPLAAIGMTDSMWERVWGERGVVRRNAMLIT